MLQRTYLTLLLVLIVGFPGAALAAVPVWEGETSSVSLFGLTRAGYRVQDAGDTTTAQTFLRFGRLGAKGSMEGVGSTTIAAELAGGVALLDLIGELTLLDPLIIRAGQYKQPLSLEFNTAADQFPFVGRTLFLGRIAPARLAGTELELELGDDQFSVEGRVGLWNPAPRPLREEVYFGQYIIAAVDFGFEFGLVHVGFLEHVLADNPTVPAERPAPYDRQLDFGVLLDPGNTRLILEGLVAFEGPFGDPAYAAHGEFLYRIGDFDDGFVWAPAVAYDYIDDAEPGEEHQGRVGVNLHLQKFAAVVGLYYGGRLFTETDDLAHTAEAQLQLGF